MDNRDYIKVSKLKWYLTKKGYVKATTRPQIWMHHLVAGYPPVGFEIDHRDLNRRNNRRRNLRRVTHSQNLANQRAHYNNGTGFKGVNETRAGGRFTARIRFEGKDLAIGTFSSALEAAKNYDKVAKRLFGEFARTNF